MKNILKALAAISLVVTPVGATVQSCSDKRLPLNLFFKEVDLGYLEDLKKETVWKAIKTANPDVDYNGLSLVISIDHAVLTNDLISDKYIRASTCRFWYTTKIGVLKKGFYNIHIYMQMYSSITRRIAFSILDDNFDESSFEPIKIVYSPEIVSITEPIYDLSKRRIYYDIQLMDNLSVDEATQTGFDFYWNEAKIYSIEIKITF